jgi:hypothetical protein
LTGGDADPIFNLQAAAGAHPQELSPGDPAGAPLDVFVNLRVHAICLFSIA